ncbi:rhodanese-like domain-containing protein [Glaciecola sp.]|jgi:phage shock protein E|uniref:rhodanese-like domain-containing protein n=1 Tax=Glaciecola sp. MF2-115 TaxID=3384827 RepID=UPI0039897481
MNKIKQSLWSSSITLGLKSLTKPIAYVCLVLISSLSFASEDITQDALLKMEESSRLLLDVRTVEEYASGHIPTSINVPLDEVDTSLKSLMEFKDAPIVVYCRSGRRAGKAISILEENGFTNVMHLEGDMSAWEAANRPTNQAPTKN